MASTIRNSSSVSVDFNAEINGAMTATSSTEGREMKLAVAIYQAPELFNVRAILTAEKKGEAINKALAANSPAFADKVSKLAELKKAKKGEANVAVSVDLSLKIDELNRSMAGASSMFNRACLAAYMLKSRHAIVEKIDNRSVKVRYQTAYTPSPTVQPRTTDILTRKEMVEAGTKLLKEQGAIKSRETKGAGSKTVSVKDRLKEVNSVSDNFKVLNDVVSTLTGNAKDELTSDDNANKLLATMIRAQFAHEGSISVADLVDFIRENCKGVKVETTPAKKAA